jgi:hypothetical protein
LLFENRDGRPSLWLILHTGRSIERCAGNKIDWTSRQPDLSFRL